MRTGASHCCAIGPSDNGGPICDVLPIAPSTYYDHLAERADPARRSDRASRDEALRREIRLLFEENWRVYGVRKIWQQLGREGFDIARGSVHGHVLTQ
jgi:putative transposase